MYLQMGHLLIGHGSMAVAHTKVDYPQNVLYSVTVAKVTEACDFSLQQNT